MVKFSLPCHCCQIIPEHCAAVVLVVRISSSGIVQRNLRVLDVLVNKHSTSWRLKSSGNLHGADSYTIKLFTVFLVCRSDVGLTCGKKEAQDLFLATYTRDKMMRSGGLLRLQQHGVSVGSPRADQYVVAVVHGACGLLFCASISANSFQNHRR